MRTRLLLVVLLLASSVPGRTGERVSLRVTPSVAFAPATLSVQATVDANAENRALEIIAESAEFYRSSEVTLDGDRAPRVTQFQFRSVPSGRYNVRAILMDAQRHELASTDTHVDIVGDTETP